LENIPDDPYGCSHRKHQESARSGPDFAVVAALHCVCAVPGADAERSGWTRPVRNENFRRSRFVDGMVDSVVVKRLPDAHRGMPPADGVVFNAALAILPRRAWTK
jgi:hypothetical protein